MSLSSSTCCRSLCDLPPAADHPNASCVVHVRTLLQEEDLFLTLSADFKIKQNYIFVKCNIFNGSGVSNWCAGKAGLSNRSQPAQQALNALNNDKIMKNNKYMQWALVTGMAASLVAAVPAFALTTQVGVGLGVGVNENNSDGGKSVEMHNGANGGMMLNANGIWGTVSAVNGNSITVNVKGKMHDESNASATTYVVDASNATIYKGGVTSTVGISSVAVGDNVMVTGTISGTSVVATNIRDGVMQKSGPVMMGEGRGHGTSTASSTHSMMTSLIKGNGEPIIAGNVTAVSGTTLTVTNASNITYTINGASATIVKKGTINTISSVSVGDSLVIQGVVNGTSVTAASIIDSGTKSANGSSTNVSSTEGNGGFHFGFGIFGSIGGFFKHLFGF
jgi:hypothetical protein